MMTQKETTDYFYEIWKQYRKAKEKRKGYSAMTTEHSILTREKNILKAKLETVANILETPIKELGCNAFNRLILESSDKQEK